MTETCVVAGFPAPNVLLALGKNVLLYLHSLHAEFKFCRFGHVVLRSAALLMLGLWLAVLGLAASQKLHQCLHADASHPEHECLVSALAKGTLVDLPVSAPTVQAAALGEVFLPTLICVISGQIDLRLAPGRAPPASIVLL